MRVQLHGVHVRLTQALRESVDMQLRRPLERLLRNPSAELEVHLCDNNGPKGGLDKEVRVTLRIPGKNTLHLEESSEQLEKSLRLVHDRLTRAVKRELQHDG